MYGYPKNKCINGVLKADFDKKCKPKPGRNPVDCIKSVDPTTLPPCSKVLLQQIKQVCCVAYLYSTAYDAYPDFDLFPIDYGYKLNENGESLEMHWFDGNQTPDSKLKSLKLMEMKEIVSMKITLTLTILTLRMKKVMTSLMMLKFKLVSLK